MNSHLKLWTDWSSSTEQKCSAAHCGRDILNLSPNLLKEKEELQNMMVLLSLYSVFFSPDSVGLPRLQVRTAKGEGLGGGCGSRNGIIAASVKARLVSEGFGMLWLHTKNSALFFITILINSHHLGSWELHCTEQQGK